MNKLELQKMANEVRKGIVTGVHAAKAGHPGGSLSAADLFTYLYFEEMNVDPKNPQDPDRDRFVLSKGHTAPGYYAALAHRGFFPVEDLTTLRKVGSYLQGHPDMKHIPGVDMSSGSLGQGISAAAGMALSAKLSGDSYRVYTLLGDGEIQEGQVWEAAMFAGARKLDNLVVIVDNNGLQIDGKIETFRQSTDPSVNWTDEEKKSHENDLWYDTTNNVVKMWNGSSWDNFTGDVPESVWNEINGKAQIFTDTPTVPYNKGDLWVDGSDILTCMTSKTDKETYSKDDWQKKNSYTDNSALNEFKNNVGYTQINSEWVISPNIKGGHLMITQNGSQYSAEITPDGKLKATGAEITGAITATSGSFTGAITATSLTLSGCKIDYNTDNGKKQHRNSKVGKNYHNLESSGPKVGKTLYFWACIPHFGTDTVEKQGSGCIICAEKAILKDVAGQKNIQEETRL